jgi:hypothetical protein
MTVEENDEVLRFLADLREIRRKTVRIINILGKEYGETEQVEKGLAIVSVQSYLYGLIDDIGGIFNRWRVFDDSKGFDR